MGYYVCSGYGSISAGIFCAHLGFQRKCTNINTNFECKSHIIFSLCLIASSTSTSGGTPTNKYKNGTGPIFIPMVQCPADGSDDAYVTCLQEVDLGLSECDHTNDIGVICEGVIFMCMDKSCPSMPWVYVTYSPQLVTQKAILGESKRHSIYLPIAIKQRYQIIQSD